MTKRKNVRQKQYPQKFTIRATKEEHKRLENRAKEAHLSLSRFLVESGLSGSAVTWEDKQRRERAVVQLNRAGNNLNQIAKRLNAQRGVIDYANLEQTVRAIKVLLQEIEDWKR